MWSSQAVCIEFFPLLVSSPPKRASYCQAYDHRYSCMPNRFPQSHKLWDIAPHWTCHKFLYFPNYIIPLLPIDDSKTKISLKKILDCIFLEMKSFVVFDKQRLEKHFSMGTVFAVWDLEEQHPRIVRRWTTLQECLNRDTRMIRKVLLVEEWRRRHFECWRKEEKSQYVYDLHNNDQLINKHHIISSQFYKLFL